MRGKRRKPGTGQKGGSGGPEVGGFLGKRQLAPSPRKLTFSDAGEEDQGRGRSNREESRLELACALEERSSDGSGAGRVKNIPKIAQSEPKPAG